MENQQSKTSEVAEVKKEIAPFLHPDKDVAIKIYKNFTDKEFADLMQLEGFYPQYPTPQNPL